QLKYVTTIAVGTIIYIDNTVADGSLGANIPTSNTAVMQQTSLSAIAVGPSGTTDRKVYRTAVNASQLKLVQAMGNNSTTTLTDATADSALGANAPVSDTSGLTQP